MSGSGGAWARRRNAASPRAGAGALQAAHELADWGTRAAAFVLDLIVIAGIALAAVLVAAAIAGTGAGEHQTLTVLTYAIGLPIGLIAGFFGGWTDRIFMRITDVFLAVPKLLLALAFVAALGPGIVNAALAITLTAWPPYARLARAEAMVVRNSDYVNAVRLAGASEVHIILFHIIPMCLNSVIVRVTFDMAGIILTAAGLGFIGLGAQPPLPEWGAMISTGRKYIFEQWWVATVPGFAIFIVSLGFNLLGDAVRDLLDPHLRQRR